MCIIRLMQKVFLISIPNFNTYVTGKFEHLIISSFHEHNDKRKFLSVCEGITITKYTKKMSVKSVQGRSWCTWGYNFYFFKLPQLLNSASVSCMPSPCYHEAIEGNNQILLFFLAEYFRFRLNCFGYRKNGWYNLEFLTFTF